MSKGTFMVTEDFTTEFNRVIKRFKKDAVLVGIPEEETYRTGESVINNATLLAINNFGSAANNIPARKPMDTGIALAQPEIIRLFREGAKEALSKGVKGLSRTYNRVGIVASNSVKKVINDQEGFPDVDGADPNAPKIAESTYQARQARGFQGTKALIVTGQMRNAITYVVKGEE